MDKDRYEPVLIGIDREGGWFFQENARTLLDLGISECLPRALPKDRLSLVPGDTPAIARNASKLALDVVFPVLHGPNGEDGTVQGLLELLGIPYVGAGVLGSAVGMDKDVMKRLLRDAGIRIPDFMVFGRHERERIDPADVFGRLGSPCFVKPANMGSSVGVSRVDSVEGLGEAVSEAFRHDRKILIEEAVAGREIECSVLGNESPRASLPGEIILKDGFYSYETKYLDETGATLEIPARLTDDQVRSVQEMAVRAFRILCCRGLARVDMFLAKSGEIYVNEINTMPGFTKISMYPKMWEASGIPYGELIDRLITLAFKGSET